VIQEGKLEQNIMVDVEETDSVSVQTEDGSKDLEVLGDLKEIHELLFK
jgi:hypothetical protein